MSGFTFGFFPEDTAATSRDASGDVDRRRRDARGPDAVAAPAPAPAARLTEVRVGPPPTAPRPAPRARVALSSPGDRCAPLRRVAVDADRRRMAAAATASGDGAPASASDRIPGLYEGGLKVWECSLDLCRHLLALLPPPGGDAADSSLAAALGPGGSTLELGCGHGLPACLVVRELLERRRRGEARESGGGETPETTTDDDKEPVVVFTDYNHFVLEDVTLPNIVLNCVADDDHGASWRNLQHCCRLIAGDWMELSRRLEAGTLNSGAPPQDAAAAVPADGRFDLILAAETTYTPAAARDTARLLLRHLRPSGGVGLVATKRYYFGVGGGSDAFRAAAARETTRAAGAGAVAHRLTVELAREFDDGRSNVRDLWRVRCLPIGDSEG